MSTNGTIQTSRSQATAADQYDHEIVLIDSTKSAGKARGEAPDDVQNTSKSSSGKASGVPLSRRRTRATLREELARRKYSKWQESRKDTHEDTETSSDESLHKPAGPEAKGAEANPPGPPTHEEQPYQAVQARRQYPQNKVTKGEKSRGKHEKGEYVIDILYENQRGLFWCGVPLYSHKSLLNFDPSAWQTASFRDSPVNITNAQVPDPSWEWAWKSWYVDMSQDVDEEGWQYSFAFTRGFAWHGTHPWFHSFCRRRRWLRKRAKKHPSRRHGARDRMSQGHGLNADYFTIHSPTRDSSTERTGNGQSHYSSGQGDGTEDEEDLDDISDIIALMKALKKAPVDRAKIAVVKRFLLQGGEDVFYLADRMPDIMSSLLFQNSRRQLLAYLIHACNAASEHQSKHLGKEALEQEAQERRVSSLSNAVRAAEEQVRGLEYWSDVRDMAGLDEGSEAADQCQECCPIISEGSSGKDATEVTLPESKDVSDVSDEADEYRVNNDFSEGSKEDERDPLLFLYPPWFASKSGTLVADEKRAPGLSTQRKTPIRRGGNAGSSPETVAHGQEYWQVTIREDKRLRKLPIAQGSSRLAALVVPKGTAWFFGHRTRLLSHGFSGRLQKRHYSPTVSAPNGTVEVSQTLAATHPANVNEETTAIDGPLTSKETGQPPVRIVRAAKRRQKHIASKASVNLQLKDKSILSFDWRVPLKLLEQHTHSHQTYANGEGERILVHRDVIPLFAGNLRETLWEIKVRGGCEVHVLGEETAVGVYRPVLLHGSQSSIEMAKEVMSELFRQFSPDVTGRSGDMLLSGAAAELFKEREPLLVRKVCPKDQKVRQVRVGDIRRPEEWTTLSFADYVSDLVQSTVSRAMQRHLYKNEQPHVVMVREQLVDLFTNSQYDDIISVRAFNNTLNFLYKYSMISTMRKLFVRMESLRLRMLPETFNIMLRGAAVQKDLHNYTILLKLMIQKGYKPNEGSWLALVMAVPSRAVQLRIESSMRQNGLLRSPAAVKGITSFILPGQLIGHLNSGQDMPSFIRHIGGIYGPEWMSPSSLNRVLDVLGERGSFSHALEAIKRFLERGIQPDTVSLNTLLSHCHRQGDLNQAVQLMQCLTLDVGVPVDEVTYHNLFMLAWKCQQYNLCRAVWRHGCLDAAVSYRMQELMLRSLMRNTPSQPNTRGKVWNVSAAKVIAGVALEPGTVAKLIGWSETGQQREKNLALAKEVLARDLAAALKHRPACSLTQQLTEALAQDQDWTHRQLWKETSTIWKLENAVNVPLIPRSAC